MLELTDKNFETEVIKADLPVLVDFSAVWCGPCQMAMPAIEELAKKYEGKIKVGKVDIDQSGGISQKYGVMSVPTAIIFQDGKETKRQVGFPGKDGYEKLLEEVLA